MTELHLRARVAQRGLDVEFSVAAGEVLAVLGPNGAGKSTTVAVIAGLLRADDAVVRVGNRTLTDTDRGVCVPVHDRRIGVLMQDPLLFPHLTAIGNVTFAARRHADRSEARPRARRWLAEVGADDLADRAPDELSGGQAQLVALARALAAEPEVLLLDEPLAGLDVAGAATARSVLRRVLAAESRTALLITHDLIDVLTLADRVLVLEAGRVVESGRVADVLVAPRSDFGARIAGVNLVRGRMVGPGTLCDAAGMNWHGVIAAEDSGSPAREPITMRQECVAVFAPAGVAVYREQPHGSPRNSVRVRIAALETTGGVVRVRAAAQADGAAGLSADVTPESVAEMRLQVGEQVWFTVKTQAVGIHPAARPDAGSR
ncbi:MAG: ATP-binding cassette domain-containing protein [Mycobacterium sp.]|nr:ATP-binding cassette domain-containing protein [Mycobacterium sp.]